MKKATLRKGLVIGIIASFFALSFTSAIGILNSQALIKTNGGVYEWNSNEGQKDFIEVKVIENKSYDLSDILLKDNACNLANEELFEKIIVKLMELVHISALSVAIVKGNEFVWAKGFGLYEREKNKEATDETIFLVASISKTFTATALMQLHEKGYFDLDDDVMIICHSI